jgi:hypothetical protein
MQRLISFCCGALLLVTLTIPGSGQTTDGLAALLARSQFDLSVDGRHFLLKEVNRASFLLVGGLHGDNETQALLQSLMAGLGEGPKLVIAEMSPWAANRLFNAVPEGSGVRAARRRH